MKKIIKKILIKIFNPFAKKLGFSRINNKTRITRNTNTKENLLLNFYNILLEMNFTPKHIVDVGANHGNWTREALRYFPNAQYSLFEPQYWLEKSIKDITSVNNKVKFNPFGVGKENGTFKFTIVDRDDSCSFKYTEEEAKSIGFEQLDLPIVTLNDFFIENELSIPDIIKIDAEGLDLDVLEGASNFFGKTEIFLVEAAVVNDNIKNTVLKVLEYMDEKGYKLFDITDLNRPFKPMVLWLVELVFIKKRGIMDNLKIIK